MTLEDPLSAGPMAYNGHNSNGHVELTAEEEEAVNLFMTWRGIVMLFMDRP